MHWLAWFLGFRAGGGNGSHYLFWSGAGSDIGELALFGWLYAFVRKHNCEVHGCWRLGKLTAAGGHQVCKRHHPDPQVTAAHVAEAHTRALEGNLRRR